MPTFRISAAIACLSAVVLTSAQAVSAGLAERCEALVAKARFSAVFEDAAITRDNTRSLAQLKDLSQLPSGPDHQTYGLTRVQAKVRQAMRLELLADPNGTVCAVPSIVVTLSAQELTVYLARELTKPCQRAIVDEHEMEHVGVWRRHQWAGTQLIEPALRDKFERPFYFASAEAAQTALHDRLDVVLQPLLKKLQDGITVANRELDSPQSYQASARRMAACPT